MPCLSVAAAYFGNHNVLLLVWLLLGSAVLVVAFKIDDAKKDRFLLAVVGCLGLSLLLSATSASDALVGWDIHQEFNIFLGVARSGSWDPQVGSIYNSVLSTSILPWMLSLVSGLAPLEIFRFVFPIVFSLAPVVLYGVYRRFLQPEPAFLAVFFFMAYPTFYVEMIALARQEIAELLVVVILLVLLSRRTSRTHSEVAVTVLLTMGIVVAHYSLAFIYVFLLAFSFLIVRLSRRNLSLSTAVGLLLTGAIAVSWYAFIQGGGVLVYLSRFANTLAQSIVRDFLNPVARPSMVLLGLSPGVGGPFRDMNRAIQLTVNFVLVGGLLVFALKPQKNVAERRMFPLTIFGFGLIGLMVIVPFFGKGLDFTRTYHIAALLVAPCFGYAWGSPRPLARISFLSKVWAHLHPINTRRWLLAAVALLCYFLCSSGWVYTVSMDAPTSFLLDSERMMSSPDASVRVSFFSYYTTREDVEAAHWFRSYSRPGYTVCADDISKSEVLTSYAGLPASSDVPSKCQLYLSAFNTSRSAGSLDQSTYFYLSLLNARYGLWLSTSGIVELSSAMYTTQNRICSNGGALIL